MECERCKERDDCDIYQEWLNTRDCCCPYSDYQKNIKKERKKREDNKMMKIIKMKYVGFDL